MKKIIISFLLLLSTSINSYAQAPLTTKNSTVALQISFDSEDITIDNTAGGIGFTASKINPTCTDGILCTAQLATCVVSTAGISILSNGVNTVTSTVGLPLATNSSFSVVGYDDIKNFRAIRTSGSSATLHCQYSKPKFQ